MRRRIALAALVGSVVIANGCATLGGRLQKIVIETRPPGASVLILPEEISLDTPAVLRLERRTAHTIRLDLDGYCRETVYLDRLASSSRIVPGLWGALFPPLWLLALPGVLIDTTTGSGYRLAPEHVNVFLWPADSPDRECGPANALPRKVPLPPLEPL